jgi:eukaryotic-like serine/threonine-protein kinase
MTTKSDNDTQAPERRLCDDCGTLLPPDAPAGVCPACLMKVGLESAVEDDGEGATITAGSGGATETSTSPVFKSTNNLTTGEQFGDYMIGRLLGKGGMGEVYEAEDLDSGRRMAIKVLGTRIDSPEARKRFLREGRMAAAINHPNSVYIFGTEEIDDQSVITMELVGQGTLKDKLKDKLKDQGQLSVAEAVDDILQVMAGLSAAHDKGVLHRDIKPSNCFVDTDGSVKVGDFGLSVSSLAREDTQLTMTGAVMGTPAFASPEQLRGDPLDVRSDIYSVGGTLYYLLTGQPPFDGQNVVQLLATVLDKSPEPIRKKRGDVPENLA